MDAVFKFLASQPGRWTRIIAGLALILLGLVIGGTAGWIIVIIGLVPLAAGAFDFCVFAPLFGMPFQGKDLRYSLKDTSEE